MGVPNQGKQGKTNKGVVTGPGHINRRKGKCDLRPTVETSCGATGRACYCLLVRVHDERGQVCLLSAAFKSVLLCRKQNRAEV